MKMETGNGYSVYKITSPEGKLYIGITQEENPERRWKNGSGYKHNKRFWEDICRLGWDSFRTEILMGNLSAEEALTVETELILENGTQNPEKGYNIALHGSAGWKLTEEQREERLQWYEEHPEVRQKIAEALRGREKSDETRHKLRQAHNAKPVICIEKRQLFDSMSTASQFTGVNPSLIKRCCEGTIKTGGGYHWKFWTGGNIQYEDRITLARDLSVTALELYRIPPRVCRAKRLAASQ